MHFQTVTYSTLLSLDFILAPQRPLRFHRPTVFAFWSKCRRGELSFVRTSFRTSLPCLLELGKDSCNQMSPQILALSGLNVKCTLSAHLEILQDISRFGAAARLSQHEPVYPLGSPGLGLRPRGKRAWERVKEKKDKKKKREKKRENKNWKKKKKKEWQKENMLHNCNVMSF